MLGGVQVEGRARRSGRCTQLFASNSPTRNRQAAVDIGH